MKKKTKELLLDKLNRTSGWILIISGVFLLYINITGFTSELISSNIRNIVSGIALIFLGIYVFRFEGWAIILAGIFGIVLLANSIWFSGLFSGGFIGILFELAYFILILNWIFLDK